jgi:hypothetical protein
MAVNMLTSTAMQRSANGIPAIVLTTLVLAGPTVRGGTLILFEKPYGRGEATTDRFTIEDLEASFILRALSTGAFVVKLNDEVIAQWEAEGGSPRESEKEVRLSKENTLEVTTGCNSSVKVTILAKNNQPFRVTILSPPDGAVLDEYVSPVTIAVNDFFYIKHDDYHGENPANVSCLDDVEHEPRLQGITCRVSLRTGRNTVRVAVRHHAGQKATAEVSVIVAAPRRWALEPVDESHLDASFLAFRKRLARAIKVRDNKFVTSRLVTPDQEVEEQHWQYLEAALRLGVTRRWGRDFEGPSLYTRFPEETFWVYSFTHVAVAGRNVALRAKPSLSAPVLTRLSYEVVAPVGVRLPEGESEDADLKGWRIVETPTGLWGFVHEKYIWDPCSGSVLFAKEGRRWTIQIQFESCD